MVLAELIPASQSSVEKNLHSTYRDSSELKWLTQGNYNTFHMASYKRPLEFDNKSLLNHKCLRVLVRVFSLTEDYRAKIMDSFPVSAPPSSGT